jgi:hypothetical protein
MDNQQTRSEELQPRLPSGFAKVHNRWIVLASPSLPRSYRSSPTLLPQLYQRFVCIKPFPVPVLQFIGKEKPLPLVASQYGVSHRILPVCPIVSPEAALFQAKLINTPWNDPKVEVGRPGVRPGA